MTVLGPLVRQAQAAGNTARDAHAAERAAPGARPNADDEHAGAVAAREKFQELLNEAKTTS